MKVYGGLILVQPEPFYEQKRGSIIIPHNAAKKFTRGTVVEVGMGVVAECSTVEVVHPRVEVGDRIIYYHDHGIPIMNKGVEMKFVPESAIVAILEPDDEIDEGETTDA